MGVQEGGEARLRTLDCSPSDPGAVAGVSPMLSSQCTNLSSRLPTATPLKKQTAASACAVPSSYPKPTKAI